jgi:hypothetical protein
MNNSVHHTAHVIRVTISTFSVPRNVLEKQARNMSLKPFDGNWNKMIVI